ncbi:MAG: PadR family transcriptional regulator [Candidatus Acidiferrales bacterium]
MPSQKSDVLRGTLDLMILRTLELEPMHGYGIAQRLQQLTGGAFEVSPGSFFPALYKLERKGWIRGAWGTSGNGRRARFYTLTAAGRRQLNAELKNWDRILLAIQKVLRASS